MAARTVPNLVAAELAEAIRRSRALLGLPKDYRLAIVPASDTGAVEMALWSLLGPRGLDVLAWESFGEGWAADVRQLPGLDARVLRGALRRVARPRRRQFRSATSFSSGTARPPACACRTAIGLRRDRRGLTICDATSAVFAMELPWDRLDVVTWSWQKALGGEGGHGMIALGPRAVERLQSHHPNWPIPKVFRLADGGRMNAAPVPGRDHQHAVAALRRGCH